MHSFFKPRAKRRAVSPPRPPPLSVTLATLGLLSTGVAHASSGGGGGGTTPPTCAVPSTTTCMNDRWVKTCGALYNATDPNNQASPCWNYNQSAQQSYMASAQQGATSERIFDPDSGDFLASMPPPAIPMPTSRTATNASWAAQEDLARYNAASAGSLNPLTYQRMYDTAMWTDINSCENYVYRSYYDVERWIDAMNACKGDARCVVNVSLNGMTATGPATVPGIARRRMLDADGAAIYVPNNSYTRGQQLLTQGLVKQSELDALDDNYTLGEMPKNMFYANTQSFVVPALIAAFQNRGTSPQLQNLINELNRGSTLYEVGDTHVGGSWYMDSHNRAHQGFYDEWDFHHKMSQRTATLTHGESREYRRREEALHQQFDLFADEIKCLVANATVPGGCNASVPNAVGKLQPGDLQPWEGDPLAVRFIFSQVASTAFVTPPALQGQIGIGSQLQPGRYTLNHILTTGLNSGVDMIPPTAHLPGMLLAQSVRTNARTSAGDIPTTPPPPLISDWTPSVDPAAQIATGNLAWFMNQTWTVNPPLVDTTVSYPHLLCNPRRLTVDTYLHTEKVWVDACRLTNLLLEEWGRMQSGKPSCLDRNSSACDWLPQDFVDRFVTKEVDYMSAAKEVEYGWCKRWTGGGQLTSSNPQIGVSNRISLNNLRGTLNSRQTQFEQKLKKTPVRGNDDFGTLRTDSQHIGNDTFGGGYSYSLGWHAQVKNRNASGTICRMGGNVLAQFTADATLFGSKPLSVIDSRVLVSSNENDDGKAYGDAKLYVVGYQVFDTDPNHTGQHIDISAATYTRPFVDFGQEQVLTVPFQAGPVTVTISAGIAYGYGGVVTLAAKAPAAGSCNPTSAAYQTSATFLPFANLGVWADADASLAGLVGVGLEVNLTLVNMSLPLSAKVGLGADANQNMSLTFDLGLDLNLTTLKGEIDLYLKALFMKVSSFTLVRWGGLSHTFPIFRTHESLPLFLLTPGSITPPTPGADT